MKDIHCHLLYGIDDGSKSIEESIKLLKDLENSGVTDVVLTPHYIENSKYNCNNHDKMSLFNIVKDKCREENINLKLYLGNEIFFTDDIDELIKRDEVSTINNSKYVLFEFPMRQRYNNTFEILNKLISLGYVPILAHPERYEMFLKNPDLVYDYLKRGILLQGNYSSLFGKYGRGSKKVLKYYLKKKWISVLGSDTHHEVIGNSKALEKKLYRYTKDKDYVEDLIKNNFDKIINNEYIEMIR